MRSIVVAALLLALHAPAFAAPVAQPASGASADPKTSAPRKVDVNRATAAELVGVPGVGERLAEAIIELRQRKGSFTKMDDLLEVRGIGEKNLAMIAEHLTIAQQAAPPAGGTASQAK
jgi:competence protein ComEA